MPNTIKNNKNFLGFTLIELLVVISIIGVLATLVLVSYTHAQKQARDASRRSDLIQYRNGLQNYAVSYGGKYPVHPEAYDAVSFCNAGGELENYLSTCPRDPDQSKTYWYISSPDGYTYTLYADIETGKWLFLSSTGETDKTSEEVAGLPPEKEGFSGIGTGGTTTGETPSPTPTPVSQPQLPTPTPTTAGTTQPTPTPTTAGTTQPTPTPTTSCVCTSWVYGSCGSPCPATFIRRTRTCTPTGCDSTSDCMPHPICGYTTPTPVPLPSCLQKCSSSSYNCVRCGCTSGDSNYNWYSLGSSSDCTTCYCGVPL